VHFKPGGLRARLLVLFHGTGGFNRNLSTAEIVASVARKRELGEAADGLPGERIGPTSCSWGWRAARQFPRRGAALRIFLDDFGFDCRAGA